MSTSLTLVGDINLMGVTDPDAPFSLIRERLANADLVFANLECCLYDNPGERSVNAEGFYASPSCGRALEQASVAVVGNANNVNYGAPAIRSSLDCLDALGIAFTGAGRDRAEAYRPQIVERDETRFGFMQRTSVYWTHGHEAEEETPGVAVLPGHTAYRPRVEDLRSLTRPGTAPEVLTWVERQDLQSHARDIALLREQCDILVASQHWGLDGEVLDYQRQIAQNAVDAGADIVFGHGPHVPLPVEWYRGAPIVYGAGSFSFETGHKARKHPDWLGLMVECEIEAEHVESVHLQFVRHDATNRTVLRAASDEPEALARLRTRSLELNAILTVDGERIRVEPAN